MKSTILSAAALAAAIAVGACQSNNHADGRDNHDDDGVEVRINESEVPAKVRQGFDRAFPEARVSEVSKETYPNGTVHYEFEFVNKDGKQVDVEFDADGERLPDH